jgi:hypothetical protein
MAGPGGHGYVQIPWYATVFRGDQFADALAEIAPIALRYGATEYAVYRYREDRYRFLQLAYFEEEADWERYWFGEEFVAWRAQYSSWYQVLVVPDWSDAVSRGAIEQEAPAEAEAAAE